MKTRIIFSRIASPGLVSAVVAPTSPTAVSTPAPAPVVVIHTVVNVVDGDNVDAAGSDGSSFRIRVIGIGVPEMGAREGQPAAQAMIDRLLNKTVTLNVGGDGEDVDTDDRKLRFIDVDGQDAGLALSNSGNAIARFDSRDGYRRHPRENANIAADAATPNCPAPVRPSARPRAPADTADRLMYQRSGPKPQAAPAASDSPACYLLRQLRGRTRRRCRAAVCG